MKENKIFQTILLYLFLQILLSLLIFTYKEISEKTIDASLWSTPKKLYHKTSNKIYEWYSLSEFSDKLEVSAQDPDLKFKEEGLFYKDKIFSGYIVNTFEANGVTRKTPFENGILEGRELETFLDGSLATERNYKNGQREGMQRGFYPNGNPRFEYNYEEGLLHGILKEWDSEGNLYSVTKMEKGQEVGRKVWREDGQIYANYVFKNGKLVGLAGGKLCRQVKGGDNGKTESF